jgi:hypothetical protein
MTATNDAGQYGMAMSILKNGFVGIGTSTPNADLHIYDAINGHTALYVGGRQGGFLSLDNNGSNGAMIGRIDSDAFQFTGYGNTTLYIHPLDNRVGIGTTSPQYALSVNGTVQAKEVIVNTGWADYVFEPDYKISSLDSLSAYIRANHHLPNIPSEAEIKQHGANVGEMQAKLLAKIEELTLQLIQEHDQNKLPEQSNRETRRRLEDLESKFAQQ